MSAKDMAKIGLSCLNNGYYEGHQIVPLKWRRERTTFREVNSGNFSRILYGYLWWGIDPKKNIYAAIGNCGNVIYINPEKILSSH